MRFAGFLIVPLILAGAALMAVRARISVPLPAILERAQPPAPTPFVKPPLPLPAELVGALVPCFLDGPFEPLAAPGAIVLHSTSGLPFETAIAEMKKRGLSVHILIDALGRAHQLVPFDRQARAARAMDDVALHVSVVGGVGADLLANTTQVEACARITSLLAGHFRIFPSNQNVIGRVGIFSHMQVKHRFGGLRRGETEHGWEPGEAYVEEILRRLGGTFFEEKKWHAREADGWCLLAKDKRGVAKATKGRDLTPPARVALAACESEEGLQPASYRMKYIDRGRLTELRGIVLHFTYTETMADAIQAWENDGFGPHIVVDTDGKAYQIVDGLQELVAAAGGTNEWCAQVEIVGKGQTVLLANEAQTAKVVAVVQELARQHAIPLTNGDIEERRGVFSHGQAKKRWGRSRTLTGSEFDPGEKYMKTVIERAGGAYLPEERWKGRTGGEWTIEFDDWLP